MSMRHVRPPTLTGRSSSTCAPVTSRMSSATSNSRRDWPRAWHRAHPVPATREATVVTHSWSFAHRQRHNTFVLGHMFAGTRSVSRFITNSPAMAGCKAASDRSNGALLLLSARRSSAQSGHPLPLTTRLTTVASHLRLHAKHRHWQRSTELGRRSCRRKDGLVRLATSSGTSVGARSAADWVLGVGRRRWSPRRRLPHATHPRPMVRFETVASHSCAQTRHRHRQRCFELFRRSVGPISGRVRFDTNSAAISGKRSARLLPAGACARDLARFSQAHRGHPVPVDRAAGVAIHSSRHWEHRQITGRLLFVPRLSSATVVRPTVSTASANSSGAVSLRRD